MENRKVAAAVIAALAGSSVALAADQAAAPGAQDDQLQEIVVTGSNIPVAGTPMVPVVVLGPKEMEESGVTTNALELLRKTVPSFAGRSNAGNSNASNVNQATGGGSQIELRNLPTLVLVDGRRITYSSINGSGGKNFVDVNMFPVAAIDHIEVLTDGASSIYGSDAIGGVVNIILKHDYDGIETSGRYAITDNDGHYTERNASAVYGTKFGNTSITASVNWTRSDPLFQSQRAFSTPDNRTQLIFPSSISNTDYLNPALISPSQANPVGPNATANNINALTANGTYIPSSASTSPQVNIAPYTSMLLQEKLKSATLEFNSRILDNRLVAFGNMIFSSSQSSNETTTSLSNTFATTTVPAGSPFDPLTTAFPKAVVGTASGPQQTLNDSNAFLMTFGLRGDITHDWNWEVGYTYSRSRLVQQYTNTIFQPALTQAIAGGYDANGNPVAGGNYSKVTSGFNINGPLVLQPALDPFARVINPAAVANIDGTSRADTAASLGSADFKVVGKAFRLPAGPVGVAVGAATRLETVSGQPDQNLYTGTTDPTKHNWANASAFDPFSKGRTVTAYFAETRVPLTSSSWNLPAFHALDLSLALRTEHYSDAGTSTVPKIGVRWQPFDEQLTLRYTYSKSFAAPFLVDEYGPPSYSLGGQPGGLCPQPAAGQPAACGNPTLKVNSGVQFFSGNGNNPSLQPSVAWSHTVGFTLAPRAIKGLTVSADYFNVFQGGFQAGIGAATIFNSVAALGSASPFFSAVSVGAAPGLPNSTRTPLAAPGSIVSYVNAGNTDLYLLDHKINSGGVLERAIDFSVNYDLPTDGWGAFSFATTGTHLISTLVSPTPGAAYHQFAGYSTNANLFAGSAAKWSAYTTVDWKLKDFDFVVGNTFRSSMTDIASGVFSDVYLSNPANYPLVTVGSYSAWDASVSYGTDRLTGIAKAARITLGATNVFNRMPPIALLSYPESKSNSNADISAYSPIGRLIFLTGSLDF